MRALLQRVTQASIHINNIETAHIQQGLCVFLGIHATDTPQTITWMSNKIIQLRIFEDETKKMNKSVHDINGAILIVPQFTLYANCQKGTIEKISNAEDHN